MSSFGVLETGIVIKTIDDILEELADDQKAAFGPAFNTSPASVAGQLNSIFGDKVAELWELAEAVYNSQYPDTATGASFDGIAALTGAERQAASQSTVTLRFNLDPGTTLNVGRVVSVSVTGDRFVTTAIAQNTTGAKANITVAAISEQYGPIVGNAGTIDTIETPVAGWTAQAAVVSANAEPFALSNGQTLDLEADNGVTQTVTFLTGDFGDIANATADEVCDVINNNTTGLECINANGALFVQSDTDGAGSAIQVTGGSANVALAFDTELVAGMNDNDAELGVNLESTTDFRIRREELIRLPGAATVESLRSTLLNVTDIVQAFVFENTDLVVDSNGIPGKSFEVVALGATDADIAQAIFDQRPLGIESYRDPGPQGRSVVINDSQGNPHTMNFTRASQIRMYVEVDVTVNLAIFGGGNQDAGEQEVKDAIALLGSRQIIGQTVYIHQFACAPLQVSGVVDVPATKIEDVFPPTNTSNIVLNVREIATFDTSDIVVNVTGI